MAAWLLQLGFVADLLSKRMPAGACVQRAARFRRLLALPPRREPLALSACVGVPTFNILYRFLLAIGLSVAELLLRVARRP